MTETGGAASPRTEAGKRLLADPDALFDEGNAIQDNGAVIDDERLRAAILAIEAEAAQEAPAPEGLRDAALDLLAALRSWEQSWQTSGEGYGGVRKAKIALARVATPPTPAEPPHTDEDWPFDDPAVRAYLDELQRRHREYEETLIQRALRAEARPPEGLDAALAALERMREFAEHERGCIFAVDLSGVNGDEWQGRNARPCNCGFDAALALYDAALVVRLSAGGATGDRKMAVSTHQHGGDPRLVTDPPVTPYSTGNDETLPRSAGGATKPDDLERIGEQDWRDEELPGSY